MIVGQNVDLAAVPLQLGYARAFELLAGLVDADVFGILCHVGILAVFLLLGFQDRPVGPVVRKDFFAGFVNFHELAAGSDEGIAVRQALKTDRLIVAAMFPQNRALEVAFGDAIEIVFRNQDAVARQNLGAPWIIQAIDLPAFLVARAEFKEAAHVGVRVNAHQERVAQVMVV